MEKADMATYAAKATGCNGCLFLRVEFDFLGRIAFNHAAGQRIIPRLVRARFVIVSIID